MSDTVLDFAALKGRTPPGYPTDALILYSPREGKQIREAIIAILGSARHSILVNMYGYDDDAADAIIRQKAADPNIYVQMSLDSSQAGGKHEKAILAQWNNDAIGTSIAIGRSVRGAISHLKVAIVDGIYMISGSTNWSLGGETLQDNQMMITANPVLAAEAAAVLNINHDAMLKQMAAARAKAPTKGTP